MACRHGRALTFVWVILLLSSPSVSEYSDASVHLAPPVGRAGGIAMPAGGVRVGLLAQGVFWKGLFRDVEIVTWGNRPARS
eukprot:227121-Rhodomonas_salina.1